MNLIERIEGADWLMFLVVIVPQIVFLFGALIMAEVDHKRSLRSIRETHDD